MHPPPPKCVCLFHRPMRATWLSDASLTAKTGVSFAEVAYNSEPVTARICCLDAVSVYALMIAIVIDMHKQTGKLSRGAESRSLKHQ